MVPALGKLREVRGTSFVGANEIKGEATRLEWATRQRAPV
jgi:hypothetical protein